MLARGGPRGCDASAGSACSPLRGRGARLNDGGVSTGTPPDTGCALAGSEPVTVSGAGSQLVFP